MRALFQSRQESDQGLVPDGTHVEVSISFVTLALLLKVLVDAGCDVAVQVDAASPVAFGC